MNEECKTVEEEKCEEQMEMECHTVDKNACTSIKEEVSHISQEQNFKTIQNNSKTEYDTIPVRFACQQVRLRAVKRRRHHVAWCLMMSVGMSLRQGLMRSAGQWDKSWSVM